ncbi:MAG: sigma factor-like helix-turn-helix DNA-binding protein [Dysosmobacter sp.]
MKLCGKAVQKSGRPGAKNLIALRYGQELTMEEIGRLCGISKMAVSKRLRRLHEKLRSSVT